MTPRPCTTCGTPTTATRCPPCERTHQHHRNARRTQYHGPWAATAKQRITQHLEEHGPICPGYETPPHPTTPTDLCCDHIDVADPTTPLGVLCRSCNGRKGATTDRRTHATQGGTPTTGTSPWGQHP